MTRWGSTRIPFVAGFVLVALGMTPTPAGAATGNSFLSVLHGLPKFTADVYVNGKLTLDGFKPESLTDPLALPPGTYDVAIRNVGDDPNATPVLEASLTLAAGRNYTAVAHLDGAGQPQLSLFRNDLNPVPPGDGRLVLRNVAFTPALRVMLDGQGRFTDFAPMSQERAVLPARTYSISMAADDGTSIGPMPLRLSEGHAAFVYVIGSAKEKSLDLMFQTVANLQSAPGDVLTGTGGAAAPPGFPRWASVLMALAAITSVLALAGRLRLPTRPDRIR
jgi:hypothetical protein